jgi:hypothetical protein
MSTPNENSEPRPAGDATPRPAPRDLAFRRERTIAILSEGFARNLMEVEELERRVAEANAARNLAQLDRLIDDIPEELHALSLRTGGASGVGGASGPGRREELDTSRDAGRRGRRGSPGSRVSGTVARDLSGEEQGVYGVLMTRSLRGHWLKSRVVAVRTVMSSTELDFREVELPLDEVEVRIGSVMSSVVVTVPEWLPVDSEVIPVLGEVKETRRVRAARGAEQPRLRISGYVVLGEVKIRAR